MIALIIADEMYPSFCLFLLYRKFSPYRTQSVFYLFKQNSFIIHIMLYSCYMLLQCLDCKLDCKSYILTSTWRNVISALPLHKADKRTPLFLDLKAVLALTDGEIHISQKINVSIRSRLSKYIFISLKSVEICR